MIELMRHQVRAVQLARSNPRFAFWWEPGCGKTMAILGIHKDRPMRTIVVCPKSIIRSAWVADAEKFGVGMEIGVFVGTPAKRRGLLTDWQKLDEPRIIVTNYELFRNFWRELIIDCKVSRLVIDESSKLKNPRTHITRASIEAAKWVDEVYLLSGTPAPNNPSEYWGQLHLVDEQLAASPAFPDKPSFTSWSGYYFTPSKRTFSDAKGNKHEAIVDWRLKENRKTEFTARLKASGEFVRKIDCVDLPKQTDQVIKFPLAPIELGRYHEVMAELATVLDGEKVDVHARAVLMKLRQLTGGHMIVTPAAIAPFTDNHVRRQKAIKTGESKMLALDDLLGTLEGFPIVIWASFRCEIQRILAHLVKNRRRKARVLWGGTIAPETIIERFQAGELDALVCQPQAVAHGITLTSASHAIYYSHDWSYETHVQSKDRIHRIGQLRPVTYYHLVADNSIDEFILRNLRSKDHKATSIIDIVRQLLGVDQHETA